jgi:hypothetical protein
VSISFAQMPHIVVALRHLSDRACPQPACGCCPPF